MGGDTGSQFWGAEPIELPEIDLSVFHRVHGNYNSEQAAREVRKSHPDFPEIDPSVLHADRNEKKSEQAAKSASKERPDEPDWTSQRKAAPFNKLLGSTSRWAEALPPEVRPHALMAQYPRLANMAAASWEIEKAFRDYLDLLLVDRRGGRKGFPPEILAEFENLRNYRFHGVFRLKANPSFYKPNR